MKNKPTKYFIKKLVPYKIVLFIFLALLLILLFIWKKEEKSIVIPTENVVETQHWKTYNNSQFRFSFKYPEGEISDLQEIKYGETTQRLSKEVRETSANSKGVVSEYNVKFGVDVYKTEMALDKFVEENLLETRKLNQETLIYKDLKGIRIGNQQINSNVYFVYYIIKNLKNIYIFALFSDDPVLIDANIPLLEKIISTARFY